MEPASGAKVSCPAGHETGQSLPTLLRVYGRQDARRGLLQADFGRFTCPTCQMSFEVDQAMTYVDQARGQVIRMQRRSDLRAWRRWEQVAPTLFEEKRRKALARGAVRPALCRLVFGTQALREKLLLWESGLDDRLIEVMKAELLEDPSSGLLATGRISLLLERLEVGAGRLIFLADTLPSAGTPERVDLYLQRYSLLLNQKSGLERYPELFQQPFVSVLRYHLDARFP